MAASILVDIVHHKRSEVRHLEMAIEAARHSQESVISGKIRKLVGAHRESLKRIYQTFAETYEKALTHLCSCNGITYLIQSSDISDYFDKLISIEEDLPQEASIPSTRPFTAALSSSGLSIIAEIKRRSPSVASIGDIEDVKILAAAYASQGAAAISCLTDARFFGGSLTDLSNVVDCVSNAHSHTPVLRKDFIISPLQVAESRVWGASALLLMVNVLGPYTLLLHQCCEELGVETLIEIHGEKELKLIEYLIRQPSLIDGKRYEEMFEGSPRLAVGVNSRDLKTFHVDANLTQLVLRKLPPSVVRIAESGISSREIAHRMRSAGADGALVGETLVRAVAKGQNMISLFRSPPAPWIKICGISSLEFTQKIVHSNSLHPKVALIGIVFHEESKRCVKDLDVARRICECANSGGIGVWGVFGAPDTQEFISNVLQNVPLQGVQIHGELCFDKIAALKRIHTSPYTWVPVISVPVGEKVELIDSEEINQWCEANSVDQMSTPLRKPTGTNACEAFISPLSTASTVIMLDTKMPGAGMSFTWEGTRIGRRVPLAVAGGIDLYNANRATESLAPDLLDLSSSVETPPGSGCKDILKIQDLLKSVNSAS